MTVRISYLSSTRSVPIYTIEGRAFMHKTAGKIINSVLTKT